MKHVANGVLAIMAVVLSVSSYAQKVMNDPTYSENNYKHPNKAAYVKKQKDAQPVVYLEEVKEGPEANTKQENAVASEGNYKGMDPSKAKTKQFRATSSPSAAPYHQAPAYNGNYKQQFPSRSRKTVTEVDKQNGETPMATN